ncbi:hypothetical protein [Shewanella sp. KCT]|uniref:hypothetical protein n=1 Tax=Shewanella sp. KCT TaxID=2569535 RepID=UPI0011844C0D|nr:hypothetical protein [Shewanella sp. KCT]TVP14359.1 hypothetical protein AYI87_11030 [Shewanella sp. KCT]
MAFAQISNFISETRGIFDLLADQIWCMTNNLDDETDLILSCFGAVWGLLWGKNRVKNEPKMKNRFPGIGPEKRN